MVVEIISVGTELLMGSILNTNAQHIAKKLAHMGLDAYYQTVVGDNPERLRAALDIAYTRADCVITTGGLGPTKDDLTKEMLISYFDCTPVEDPEALRRLETRAAKRGIPLSESMRKQATVPSGAIVLQNENGTAPGVIIEHGGRACIMLPGPPKEMKPMFETACDVFLRGKSDKVFVSMNVKLYTMAEKGLPVGESPVADRLGTLVDGQNPTVATYAKEDGVLVRVTAAAPSTEEARELLAPILAATREAIGDDYIRYVEED
jgi:competence/damage-inducible protein cinA